MKYPGVYKTTMLFLEQYDLDHPPKAKPEFVVTKSQLVAALLSLFLYGVFGGVVWLLYWLAKHLR